MIWLSVVGIALAVTCAYVLAPLTGAVTTRPDSSSATADREREALVEELRELDLDLELGKIEQPQYETLRADRERRLARLLTPDVAP